MVTKDYLSMQFQLIQFFYEFFWIWQQYEIKS